MQKGRILSFTAVSLDPGSRLEAQGNSYAAGQFSTHTCGVGQPEVMEVRLAHLEMSKNIRKGLYLEGNGPA